MTNQTTENFLKAMQEFQWTDPLPVSYRLYHDDQGRPLFYTMEDLSGTYIEVDQQTYVTANYSVKVVEGKLVVLDSKSKATKLVPSQDQGVCCHPQDICVIVAPDQRNQRWKPNTDEQD